MTSTLPPRVIDIDDTVTIHQPGETTRRIIPAPRRPVANPNPNRFEERRSFAFVGRLTEPPLMGLEPASTGTLPLPAQAAISRERAAAHRRRAGRHRLPAGRGWLLRVVGVLLVPAACVVLLLLAVTR